MSPLADLALCMGPSTNCQFLTNIALQFENTGTYSWKVDCSLAPTTSNAGYGMQIIDDATGQYQYSTQFGIVADTVACSGSQPSRGGPWWAPDSTTAPSGSPTSGGGHTRTGHSGSGSMTTSTTGAGSAPSGTGSGTAPTGPAGGYGLNSTSTAYVVPTGPAGGSQPAATPAGSSGASSVARGVGGVAVAVLAAGVFLAWA
jgi:hypothetical protein